MAHCSSAHSDQAVFLPKHEKSVSDNFKFNPKSSGSGTDSCEIDENDSPFAHMEVGLKQKVFETRPRKGRLNFCRGVITILNQMWDHSNDVDQSGAVRRSQLHCAG